MNHHRPRARSRWAAAGVLALLAASLHPAAHASADRPERPIVAGSNVPASTTASISGTVTIPAGIDPSDSELYVDAFRFDPETGLWEFTESEGLWFEVDLRGDGSFRIDGLEAGREYRLRIDVYTDGYLTGFYAGDGQPFVRTAEAGTGVHAPADALRLAPLQAATISGTFTVPEGFDWSPDQLRVRATELDREDEALWNSRSLWMGPSATTFALDVYPGVEYVLHVDDPVARIGSGYFHAGASGLVEHVRHATRLPAGSRVDLVVATSFAAPQLTSIDAPEVQGTPVVGETLSVDSGRWSLAGTTLSYQWLRDGVEIPGATQPSLTLTADDVGSRLAVRESAALADFEPATATSATTAPVARAAAPRATTAPSVTGQARFGKKLRVTSGTWDVPGATVTYQWLRAGTPIAGATAKTYRLRKADVGKRVTARVTARVPGHTDGAATSSSVKVKKAAPTLRVTAKRVKASKRPRVVVRVTAGTLAKPRGTVRVTYAGKSVRVKVRAKDRGKVVVRLPRLEKGKHRLVVRYSPAKATKKLATKAGPVRVTLRVR